MGSIISVLGVDPGNKTGIAIYIADSTTLDIIDIKTILLPLDSLVETKEHNYNIKRKIILNNKINTIVKNYSTIAVGLEAPFTNPKFPKASITLSDYISSIELTLYGSSPFIKIYKFPPKTIKREIGAGGDATKHDMLLNIETINDIKNYIDFSRESEHTIDALSIGYITFENIKNNPFYLFSF